MLELGLGCLVLVLATLFVLVAIPVLFMTEFAITFPRATLLLILLLLFRRQVWVLVKLALMIVAIAFIWMLVQLSIQPS
jgi:hypothetical protein